MEESASNLINFYTNRIEELKTQLTQSNNKIEKIKEYVKSKIDIHKHLIEQWEWEEENVKEYETEPLNRPYLISMNKRILEEFEQFLSIIDGSDE